MYFALVLYSLTYIHILLSILWALLQIENKQFRFCLFLFNKHQFICSKYKTNGTKILSNSNSFSYLIFTQLLEECLVRI